MSKILVTGGAGFIGSFLVDKLVELGHEVTIFDNLEDQVHNGKKPKYLNSSAEFVLGDVSDYEEFKNVLIGKDYVFHLASAVGIGQSMYRVSHYMSANVIGISNLYDIIVNEKLSVKKVLIPTSMSSYGEGLYKCSCGTFKMGLRSLEDIDVEKGIWNPVCNDCSSEMVPVPTSEETAFDPSNVYSLSKEVQEDLSLLLGKRYGIPTICLRLFNVFGPRQSLSNPYTGVSAIFMSRLKSGNEPVAFEDGNQTRDFVYVTDVVDAFVKVLDSDVSFEVFNVGSGVPTTIKDVALVLADIFGSEIKPRITNEFRKGDVRHCYADISKASKLLGWKPVVSFKDGLKKLVSWAENEESVDLFDKADKELRSKNLI